MTEHSRSLPDADSQLVVFLAVPGVPSATVVEFLERAFGEFCFQVPFVGAYESVKDVTLQQARQIKCIITSRPVGFHKVFGSPIQEKPLPGDGLFTGREIIYASIVEDPLVRQKNLQQQISDAPTHPHHAKAKALTFEDFLEFMADVEPGLTCNQQCAYLSGTAHRTFAAAQQQMMSQPTLVAVSEQALGLAKYLTGGRLSTHDFAAAGRAEVNRRPEIADGYAKDVLENDNI